MKYHDELPFDSFESSNTFITSIYFFIIENRPENTETSVRVCEDKSLKISCKGNQKIEITAADYGRSEPSSSGVCPGLIDWSTNCHTPKALEITKEECDDFTSCTLYANNDEYGDPCWGTKKYLTVCSNTITCKHVTHQNLNWELCYCDSWKD